MIAMNFWRRAGALLSAALLLAGCNTPPAFEVSQPTTRDGTVISITQDTVQNVNTAAGGIGGALIGGGIGSLFGGGSGQTVATVIGAAGGAYVGQPGGPAQPDLRLAHRRAP